MSSLQRSRRGAVTLVECAGKRSTGCTHGGNSSGVRRQRSRRALQLGERSACGCRWRRLRGRIRPTGARSTRTTSASAATPANTLLAIDDDGEFVGTISSFTMEGEREVTYWIAPPRWGQGLASRALRAFLAIESTRPLRGRVASHNAASAKVLARAGFVEVGSETAFAPGIGAEVVERIYRLDR